MNLRFLLTFTLALGAGLLPHTSAADAKPLKVLLVTGGGFHDYDQQHLILGAGLSARANVEVTFAHNPDKTTKTKVMWDIYRQKDWGKAWDVVIHDECSAEVTDPEYVGNIIAAHRDGTPAVNLHCAMHCYRWGEFQKPVAPGADNAHWYEMLGLQSTAHGPQEPIAIDYVDKASPITRGLAGWTTTKEELYNNIQILTAHALAKGTQTVTDKKSGEKKDVQSVVAWTNEFGPKKTRIFSTTIGHNNETVADRRYLDLVTRGLLWSCGQLDEAHLKPAAGK